MKLEQAKNNWFLAKLILLFGIIFLIINKTYFLIAYGWHWGIINEFEQTCNDILIYIIIGGLSVIGVVIINIIEYLLSDNRP